MINPPPIEEVRPAFEYSNRLEKPELHSPEEQKEPLRNISGVSNYGQLAPSGPTNKYTDTATIATYHS